MTKRRKPRGDRDALMSVIKAALDIVHGDDGSFDALLRKIK